MEVFFLISFFYLIIKLSYEEAPKEPSEHTQY